LSFYCGWRPGTLVHDFKVTKLCLALKEEEWGRGNELDRNADALMFQGNNVFFVEYESGSMSYPRWEQKIRKNYSDCDETVLVVTTNKTRQEGLMEHSPWIEHIAWFGVLDEIINDPYGLVWKLADGTPKRLVRFSQN
jgi:hypothetical protein